MTRVLAVDENNDIYIGRDGRLAISAGLSAVLQACEHAAKAQLGEMIRATTSGMPNFDVLWNGAPNLTQFDAALRATLLSVVDVVRVVSLNVQNKAGVVSYYVTIETIFGEGGISG